MLITEADPTTIAMLWRRARSMFVRASGVIGAAEELAALAALTRKRRREIAGWLALVEAIVRKLIFAQAAQLRSAELAAAQASRLLRVEIVTLQSPSRTASLQARMSPAAGKTCAPQGPRSKAPFDPSQPQTWRVRFKLAPPRDPLACPERRAPRIRSFCSSTPPSGPLPPRSPREVVPAPLRLAMRLEALRRVIADPAPYARRLAHIFPHLCRRHRQAAERYAITAARPHWVDFGDARLIVEAMALAMLVAPVFANSS